MFCRHAKALRSHRNSKTEKNAENTENINEMQKLHLAVNDKKKTKKSREINR